MFDAFYNALRAIGYTHPVHATQVHMPIGLVIGAFVLGGISFLLYRFPRLRSLSPFDPSRYAGAARFCILIAFLFWFTTVAAGVMDWQHYFAGAFLFPFKVKIGLAGFLILVLFVAIIIGYRTDGMPNRLMGIYFIAAITVGSLGYFGGVVAYGDRVPPAPEKFRAGQQVFSNNCLGCHPGGANSIAPERVLWGSLMLGSSATFEAWTRNAPRPMPPFSKTAISDRQMQQMYEYLHNVMGKSAG